MRITGMTDHLLLDWPPATNDEGPGIGGPVREEEADFLSMGVEVSACGCPDPWINADPNHHGPSRSLSANERTKFRMFEPRVISTCGAQISGAQENWPQPSPKQFEDG